MVDVITSYSIHYTKLYEKEKLTSEAVDLTGLDNPNSPVQLKDWLGNEIGQPVESLTKTAMPELMEAAEGDAQLV